MTNQKCDPLQGQTLYELWSTLFVVLDAVNIDLKNFGSQKVWFTSYHLYETVNFIFFLILHLLAQNFKDKRLHSTVVSQRFKIFLEYFSTFASYHS